LDFQAIFCFGNIQQKNYFMIFGMKNELMTPQFCASVPFSPNNTTIFSFVLCVFVGNNRANWNDTAKWASVAVKRFT